MIFKNASYDPLKNINWIMLEKTGTYLKKKYTLYNIIQRFKGIF